jgi:hypothetical protein
MRLLSNRLLDPTLRIAREKPGENPFGAAELGFARGLVLKERPVLSPTGLIGLLLQPGRKIRQNGNGLADLLRHQIQQDLLAIGGDIVEARLAAGRI